MRKKNEENQKIAFLAKNPESSPNGMYFVMGGISYPSPDYCMIRTERSGIFWGGVYVFEYIISGSGYIETDGEVLKVTSGKTVFMNARRPITYYSDPNDPYKKIWVNFTGPLTHGIVSGLSLDKNVYVLDINTEQYIKEIHGIYTGMNDKSKFEAYDRMSALIFKMLSSVNSLSRSIDGEAVGFTASERVKNYIDSLSLPNVTLDELSRLLSINKNYMIHSFKDRYGISPNRYVILKKIERAKELLAEKKMSISEVSSALGYSSTQHFSKYFKLITGTSPGEYKKLFKK